MDREQALGYVALVTDDALGITDDVTTMKPDARLVGWQCGYEPMFVAVQSYLPEVQMSEDDAIELATEALQACGWFEGEPTEPDHIL